MPDKKSNVLSQFFCVFKMKKNHCEDIVSIADRVVEDYIMSKNRLIYRRCNKKSGGYSFVVTALAIGIAVTIILFCM